MLLHKLCRRQRRQGGLQPANPGDPQPPLRDASYSGSVTSGDFQGGLGDSEKPVVRTPDDDSGEVMIDPQPQALTGAMLSTALAQAHPREKCKTSSNAGPADRLKVEVNTSYSAFNNETHEEQSSKL